MEFIFNNKKFDSLNLKKLDLEKLMNSRFIFNPLFFITQDSKRPILIKNPGTYIDDKLIRKIKMNQNDFFMLEIQDQKRVENLRGFLFDFKNAKKRQERIKIREEISKMLKEDHVLELEFVFVFMEVFYKLPSSFLHEMAELNEALFLRSTRVASRIALFCLFSLVDDFEFIQDMFHLGLFLDISLLNIPYNYYLLVACEEDRNNPGRGKEYLLQHHASKDELDLYFRHPLLSFDIALKYSKYFSYPSLLEKIKFHHELGNGEGFPFGLSYFFTSKVETSIRLADEMTPFHFKDYFEPFILNTNKDLMGGAA